MTGDGDRVARPRHNQQAGVKLSSDGRQAVFWNGFTGGTESAISDGSIWNAHSLPQINGMSVKGKAKRQ